MKTPVVAECLPNGYWRWHLDSGYILDNSYILDGDVKSQYLTVSTDEGVYVGELVKSVCQELFNVILYPPGSQPSTESADPLYDIPRVDIP